MELNEMEKKLLFQVEGDYQTKILNELYMTVRYSNNSEQREAAEGLMAKLRVLSNAECMDLVKDIQKNYRLPWARRCATAAVSYLQKRGISSEVIRQCLQAGIFYEARYHGEPVCVFVGKDDSGKAKFACMRSISGNLKKDVYGSDKGYNFCYPPQSPGSPAAQQNASCRFMKPVRRLSARLPAGSYRQMGGID